MASNTNTFPAAAQQRDTNADLNAAFSYVRELSRGRYFGQVILNFQNGHLINVRRDESLKPENIHNLIATSKGNGNDTTKQ